jgi:hypothetical protein
LWNVPDFCGSVLARKVGYRFGSVGGLSSRRGFFDAAESWSIDSLRLCSDTGAAALADESGSTTSDACTGSTICAFSCQLVYRMATINLCNDNLPDPGEARIQVCKAAFLGEKRLICRAKSDGVIFDLEQVLDE